MITTDAQVRKLMEELRKHGKVGLAALRSGMSRNTAGKYKKLGRLPSELEKQRTWRTRNDPFEEDWEEMAERLKDASELEAKALFEHLMEEKPGKYEPGHLRTFQRRVKRWRAQYGPAKELFFDQAHKPGEAMQTDFTCAAELKVTINGEPFRHMFCHPVLPYSNWEWVTVCRSESMMALKRGVQSGLFQLGRVPEYHQTDNSTAATHDLRTGKRGFNDEYKDFVKHFGMKARTIMVGKKEQNGDVESLHGALKRALKQHLILRGSSDFSSVEEYEQWLWQVVEKRNLPRTKKLREDLAAMRPLKVALLPEYKEERLRVSRGATIRVKKNDYSVPSRLKYEYVKVRIYDDRVEVYYADKHELTVKRVLGAGGHSINYRHIIESLIRKPGAFRRYKYREALYPTPVFRHAYEVLAEKFNDRKADIEYLRILYLAARTMECEVEMALSLFLSEGQIPEADRVKELVVHEEFEVPQMSAFQVNLADYDGLLETRMEVGS